MKMMKIMKSSQTESDFCGEIYLFLSAAVFLIVGVYLCGYLGCAALWNCYENDPDNLLKISLLSLLVIFSIPIGFFASLPWYLLARKLLRA